MLRTITYGLKGGIVKNTKSKMSCTLLLSLFLVSVSFSEIDLKPIRGGLALEYGQMTDLVAYEQNNSTDFTINRTIGWFYQQATINENFDATLALGGMFFNFFPYNSGLFFTKAVRVSAVSVAQASATYKFGDVEDPYFKLSFGLLPYKYNDNSKNLGEYLFRSTPYPNTTINGSWDIIHSSYARLKGVVLEKDFWDGMWQNDLMVYINDADFPLHNINLGYVTKLKLGPLSLGSGINFLNLIPNRPSVTTPKNNQNAYFTAVNPATNVEEDYYSDQAYYFQIRTYHDQQAKVYFAKNTAADSALGNQHNVQRDYWEGQSEFVQGIVGDPTVWANTPKDYYTFKGTLLMGMGVLDIGSLISDEMDFKLYAEASLLGVNDYPVFYDNKMERLPIMFGLSIPTFGLLDHLNVEFEYWKNRYPIITNLYIIDGKPMIDFTSISTLGISLTEPFTDDDLKWSVSAQKSFGAYFTLNAQIARDHIRPINPDFAPYNFETIHKDGWYYLARLQVNM